MTSNTLCKAGGGPEVLLCFNCGENHSIESCELPTYFWHCPRCLVVSFDGSNHSQPCLPINTISLTRINIISRETVPLFSLRFACAECSVVYMSENGRFEELPKTLLSPVVNCIINYEISTTYNFLTVSASSFSRFSVLIAIFQKGYWRSRFRCVLTNKHGLIVFKMTSTLHMENGRFILPNALQSNTVCVIGLKPKGNELSALVNVWANREGNPSDDVATFNGYRGSISWSSTTSLSRTTEISTISDSLDGNTKKEEVKYHERLHQLKGNRPFRTFQQQRLDL